MAQRFLPTLLLSENVLAAPAVELHLIAFRIVDLIERLVGLLRFRISDRPTVNIADIRCDILQMTLLLRKRNNHVIENGILVEPVVLQELFQLSFRCV